MKPGRLPALLTCDGPDVPENYEDGDIGDVVGAWMFRPVGDGKDRIFHVWIYCDGTIGGSRCRRVVRLYEPWEFEAYLPRAMVRALLSMVPPKELANATCKLVAQREGT